MVHQAVDGGTTFFDPDGRYELYKLCLKFEQPRSQVGSCFPLDTEQSEVKDMLGAQQNTGHPFPEKQF